MNEMSRDIAAAAKGDPRGIVRDYVEAMNGGDFERLRSLFTRDAEIIGVTGAGSVDYAMPVWRQLHEGLAMQLVVEDIAAEGNVVAVRFTERGRFVGPFLGHDAPTGRTYEMAAIEWFEIEDGRIRRRWGVRDSAAQSRQIGLA